MWKNFRRGLLSASSAVTFAVLSPGIVYAVMDAGPPPSVVNEIVKALGYQCVPVWALGMKADGVSNNAPLWSNWLNSIQGASACIEFGAGKYAFSTPVAWTMPGGRLSLTVRGEGPETTILYWPTSIFGGLSITATNILNSVHLRDFAITTGSANAGTALNLAASYSNGGNLPPFSDIVNVVSRGDDYTAGSTKTDYWSYDVNISAWSDWNITNLNTFSSWETPGSSGGGIGLQIGGTGSSAYATVINVEQSSFNYKVYGIALESYWQGVTVDHTNFNGESGSAGILQAGSQSGTLGTLQVTNSQFAYYVGPQIAILSPVNNQQYSGNLITNATNGSIGIYVNTSFLGFQASNNMFDTVSFGSYPTGTYGIGITGASLTQSGGSITGNFCLGQPSQKFATCVALDTSTSSMTATGNSGVNVTNTIGNSGTNNITGNNTP